MVKRLDGVKAPWAIKIAVIGLRVRFGEWGGAVRLGWVGEGGEVGGWAGLCSPGGRAGHCLLGDLVSDRWMDRGQIRLPRSVYSRRPPKQRPAGAG